MKKKSGFLLSFILIIVVSFSQPPRSLVPGRPEDAGMSSERLARIDKYLQDYVSKKWIPGAVVLIARNGKLVYHKAFGYSDAESNTALKKDDIFRIAS